MTGADLMCQAIVDAGVHTIFGYPGGAIMPFYDALLNHPIRHVLVRHEANAGFAADGYARVSGGPGVCIATSGPGATNLATALASAWMDSVPVVAITGQVSSWLVGTDGFQETDVTGMMLPVTKWNTLVTRPEDLEVALKHSQRMALPVEVVIGVENTRATSLSWDEDTRRGFNEELRQHLESHTQVALSQETSLTMAQVLRRP